MLYIATPTFCHITQHNTTDHNRLHCLYHQPCHTRHIAPHRKTPTEMTGTRAHDAMKKVEAAIARLEDKLQKEAAYLDKLLFGANRKKLQAQKKEIEKIAAQLQEVCDTTFYVTRCGPNKGRRKSWAEYITEWTNQCEARATKRNALGLNKEEEGCDENTSFDSDEEEKRVFRNMHSHLGDAFFKHSGKMCRTMMMMGFILADYERDQFLTKCTKKHIDEHNAELTQLRQRLTVLQKRAKKEKKVVKVDGAFEKSVCALGLK